MARRGIVVALGVSFGVACSEPPALPAPTAEGSSIMLSLDSVTVAESVSRLSSATGRSLVIDPSAEPWADCAHVSLTMPAPRPADEVVLLLGSALVGSGFLLTSRPEGMVLSHAGAPRPAGCSSGAVASPRIPREPSGGVAGPDGPASVGPELAAAIREVSSTEWEITRGYRDAVETPTELAGSVRVLPGSGSGEVAGLRLFGIRRSTPLGALGFQNGDTVLSINGRALASPEAALDAYTELHEADRYEVALERRGAPRTHVYRIVDALSASPALPPGPVE